MVSWDIWAAFVGYAIGFVLAIIFSLKWYKRFE